MNNLQMNELIEAITKISHGSGFNDTPYGFEALCMTLSGTGTPGTRSIYSALDKLADAAWGIAGALGDIASAIENKE